MEAHQGIKLFFLHFVFGHYNFQFIGSLNPRQSHVYPFSNKVSAITQEMFFYFKQEDCTFV